MTRTIHRTHHRLEQPWPDKHLLTQEDLGVGPARRLLDVVVASLALVVAAPVLALAAALVLVTDGRPVLFRQPRFGEGGVPFELLKLRTMRTEREGPAVTTSRDPRLIRVGRVLRRTSCDELPQLWHVLSGRMTLVGPRPESVELGEQYPECVRFVLLARPGLTGPSQLTFRERSATPPAGQDPEQWYLRVLVPQRAEADLTYLARPTLARTIGYLWLTGLFVLGLRDHQAGAGDVVKRRRRGSPPRSGPGVRPAAG